MKKLLSVAFALAVSVPAVVLAQDVPLGLTQERFQQIDTNNDGRISEAEYRVFMESAFTKLDKNGDGYLTVTETEGVLTPEQFAKLDGNGNGQVTRDEFLSHVMADFHRQDRNKDGHL